MRRNRTVPALGAVAALAVLLVLGGIFLPGSGGPTSRPPVQPKPDQPHRLVFNGFYTNGREAWASCYSLSSHRQHIDEISPLWYHVGGNGSVSGEIDPEALRLARDSGIKILPLAALSPGGRDVLLDPGAAAKAAGRIVQIVKEGNFDGVNIDFELIKKTGYDYGAEKEGLTGFVAELKKMLSPLGKRLDVSVTPPVDPPSHLARVYDYRSLAGLADRLVLMAYDHSHPGTPPGPVAPLPWVEDNIRAILAEGAAPEKVSLGIAAYGYDWPAGSAGGRARPAAEILQAAKDGGLAVQWDQHRQTPFLKYNVAGGGPREAWFENGAAAAHKLGLAKKYRLAGISVWRLGYEDPDFWREVESSRQP